MEISITDSASAQTSHIAGHGGGGVMVLACVLATGPGNLAAIESTMITSVY